jgi:hypothetical protein
MRFYIFIFRKVLKTVSFLEVFSSFFRNSKRSLVPNQYIILIFDLSMRSRRRVRITPIRRGWTPAYKKLFKAHKKEKPHLI